MPATLAETPSQPPAGPDPRTAADHAPPQIVDRGIEEYLTTFEAMRRFTDARDVATPDQLWIVTHPPVFTLGLGADPAHVIDAGTIAVVQSDRGGEVTYHGPGQAVIYLLIDLKRGAAGGRLYAREFVRAIEQAVIDTLAAYNLAGERHPGAPGIYMAGGADHGAKIAPLGLKVRASGCTYHGVSLNVAMDLAPYARINACGYPGLASTDMRTQGATCGLAEVQQTLAAMLLQAFSALRQPPDARPAPAD